MKRPLPAVPNRPPVRPGEYEFAFEDVEGMEAIDGMAARCPCGCGAEAYLGFGAADEPRFDWNGDEAAPSLVPKVGFPCGKAFWLHGGAWSE